MRCVWSVPQGSVLGTVLFSLYTAPIEHLIQHNGSLHSSYADDVNVYSPIDASDPDACPAGVGPNHRRTVSPKALVSRIIEEWEGRGGCVTAGVARSHATPFTPTPLPLFTCAVEILYWYTLGYHWRLLGLLAALATSTNSKTDDVGYCNRLQTTWGSRLGEYYTWHAVGRKINTRCVTLAR